MSDNTFDQKTMTGFEVRDMSKVVSGPQDPMNVWALYWIAKRREDKDFTFNQALKASVEDVSEYLGLDNPLTQE